MTSTPTDLWFHAEAPLLSAATVWVELPDGRPYARFHRRDTRDGRPRWRWTGGALDDFTLEARRMGTSFLVTDPHGAPFGTIRQRGLFVPRLVAADAHHDRFTIELDGRLQAASGGRAPLGTLELRRLGDLRARLPTTADETLYALLVAAPLCHLAQALALQAA
jgi:hypothetical protein